MIYVGAVFFLWKLGPRTGMLQSQPIRCEIIARRLHSNFPVHSVGHVYVLFSSLATFNVELRYHWLIRLISF